MTALAFRSSTDIIYTAGRDSFLFIADVRDSVSFKTKESNGYINAMTFTSDGALFADGGTNNLVKVWKTEPLNSIGWYESDLHNVLGLAFLSDEKTLIVADGSGQVVFLKITDPSDTTQIQGKSIFIVGVSEMGRFKAHDGAVRGIALSSDDARLYTGGDDRTLKTWDVKAISEYFVSQAPTQK